MSQDNTYIPFKATHPGTLIKDELEMMPDMKQKDLAALLELKPSFLSEVINGKRPVTPKLALKLEKALGISADYWNMLQAQYKLDCKRIEERETINQSNVQNKAQETYNSEITDRIYQLLNEKKISLQDLSFQLKVSPKEINRELHKLYEANQIIKKMENILGEPIVKYCKK